MKVRSTSSFCAQLGEQEFNVKKQGFVSLQEKKVFNTWKKFWLVFKHMDCGTSPRVVLDAYSSESQFRSGSSPKHTFNLTGTVAPVVVCQQNHKQVRHMFVVCPPGSRYIFECDSHFGMESWVMELNESLFPRTNGVDHILTELSASFKLNGSIRHRTKSNSMNDISKIGSDPPEIPVAPSLPPPNRRPVNACTSFPDNCSVVSPAINRNSSSDSNSSEELVSRYRVEVEVSTLSQIPKGVCIVLVQRESIRLCHAVTMDSMAIWHITHIREFKLTNDDKLIITSGNRSVTGYGQVRLIGVDCRALYYKVKVFVRSKSQKTRTAVTLPDRKGMPPILPVRGTTLCADSCANGLTAMTSPPESPSINTGPGENRANSSRPLPDIPPETVYSKIGTSPSHTDNYSKLCHPDSKYNWPLNETNPFANMDQCKSTETEYSQLSAGNRCCPHADDTYNVTHHPNNQVGKRNPCNISPQRRDQNILDSLKHINLIEQSRNVRKSEAYIDFSASYSSDSFTNPYEIESLSEVRKSLSLIGSQETKRYLKRNAVSYDVVATQITEDSDSDPEIPLTDNVAYGTIKPPPSDNLPVSPYIITKPLLPPKLKKH